MVSALRGLVIGIWAVVVPVVSLTLEFRWLAHSQTPINIDVLILLVIALAALLGGAAVFCIRTSLRRRVVGFIGYTLVTSVALFLVYPALACAFSNCP
jgi:hypothetical protein